MKRVVEIRGEFEERFRPFERESVGREREEIERILNGAAALVITGGHVAVLLNRLRLFGIRELVENKSIVAWSAGAMSLPSESFSFTTIHPRERETPG